MHPAMAEVLDKMLDEIAAIQKAARQDGNKERPRWPMLILRTPKGWTGPKWSMENRSKAPGARIRCRSPNCTKNPII